MSDRQDRARRLRELALDGLPVGVVAPADPVGDAERDGRAT